ncbi:lycopene cyclase family protein [Actinokineospora sp. UTMC 2448]|uniref:lycopene cyclase family protein n=1 Tax=Actinokineospora sp. UTMC 2448 TaxID=2268449 RepID=UPI002164C781|nr:lycopene cyclase family protein [Actinokineospora sp. UTMC 2448]UVS80099.1 Lycopene beta cyclase [Actinokineospora sp. UTMC 2448]
MAAVDVIVAGSGPAGWALARACTTRGLSTTVVAPRPDAAWRPTYGLWSDQADTLPPGARMVTATEVRACGRPVDRPYAVLDNAATVAAYVAGKTPVVRDKAVGVTGTARGVTVHLDSGGEISAAVVVDATGHRRGLTGGRPPGPRVEQSAVGVVLPADVAAPLAPPGTAVFMDGWDTADGLATFLYAVPLPDGSTLVEETSLAARPGVGSDVLRARLARRLAAAGVAVPADARTERVRFPLDLPIRTPATARGHAAPVAFGSAAAMVHPATGYSVGDALATAPAVAEAIAAALPEGPAAAAAAARAAVWPRPARAVHALRRQGLRALLALPPERVPEFFAGFFAQPAGRRRAFLTGRADLAGTVAAMTAIFATSPWPIRRKLATLR